MPVFLLDQKDNKLGNVMLNSLFCLSERLFQATVIGIGKDHLFKQKPIPDGFASVTVNSTYKKGSAFVVNDFLGKQMKKDTADITLSSLVSHISLWPAAKLLHNVAPEKGKKKTASVDDLWA